MLLSSHVCLKYGYLRILEVIPLCIHNFSAKRLIFSSTVFQMHNSIFVEEGYENVVQGKGT